MNEIDELMFELQEGSLAKLVKLARKSGTSHAMSTASNAVAAANKEVGRLEKELKEAQAIEQALAANVARGKERFGSLLAQ
mmetsp:Transcript_20541/g.78731  ORF Transcript_20541/g.78731 Transcript_20541/m.78731 type:complete len:81 (+) Transcript_20541:3145-3387(+)